MKCPDCESEKIGIKNSRKEDKCGSVFEHIRRRRICKDCGFRWTTFEISEEEYKQLKGEDK